MNGWSKEDLEEMCGDDIIEQLVFLSGCHQHQLCNSNPSGWIISDESLRKFAELILQECLVLFENAKVNQEDDVDYGLEEAKNIIKEHFGVK